MDSPITAAYLKVLAYSAKVAQVMCKAANLRSYTNHRVLWRVGGGGWGVVTLISINIFCSPVITDTRQCIFFNLTLKFSIVQTMGRIPYMGDRPTAEFILILHQYLHGESSSELKS